MGKGRLKVEERIKAETDAEIQKSDSPETDTIKEEIVPDPVVSG